VPYYERKALQQPKDKSEDILNLNITDKSERHLVSGDYKPLDCDQMPNILRFYDSAAGGALNPTLPSFLIITL
jgi:hypothetical protein